LANNTWRSILLSLGVFSGTKLILSPLLPIGLSDFTKKMAAIAPHGSIAPGRSISCF